VAANFSKTLKIKAFSASYSEALLNKSIVILANQSILFGKWWDFRGENTGQKICCDREAYFDAFWSFATSCGTGVPL
jgi:hypothetical protein